MFIKSLKAKLTENISKFMSLDTDVAMIDRDSLSTKEQSIFDHYDIDKNNNWTGTELELFMSDLKKADTNQDGKYSRKEIRKFLKTIPMDKRLSVRKFNELIEKLPAYSKESRQNTSNGAIESFEQGQKPDCWLLSGVKSLSLTSWGKRAIKESIAYNDDGTLTVKLKGVNFETIISGEDIAKARSENYSKGDLDVLFIELATERYLKQEVDKGNIIREEDVLDGSDGIGTISAQYLLAGNKGLSFCLKQSKEKTIQDVSTYLFNASEATKFGYKDAQDYWLNTYSKDKFEKLLYKLSKSNDIALICSFEESENWLEKEKYTEQDKESFANIACHGYTIKAFEKDKNGNITNVILINPHDSDIIIRKNIEDFLNQVAEITVVNKNDNYEEYTEGFEQIPKKI